MSRSTLTTMLGSSGVTVAGMEVAETAVCVGDGVKVAVIVGGTGVAVAAGVAVRVGTAAGGVAGLAVAEGARVLSTAATTATVGKGVAAGGMANCQMAKIAKPSPKTAVGSSHHRPGTGFAVGGAGSV